MTYLEIKRSQASTRYLFRSLRRLSIKVTLCSQRQAFGSRSVQEFICGWLRLQLAMASQQGKSNHNDTRAFPCGSRKPPTDRASPSPTVSFNDTAGTTDIAARLPWSLLQRAVFVSLFIDSTINDRTIILVGGQTLSLPVETLQTVS